MDARVVEMEGGAELGALFRGHAVRLVRLAYLVTGSVETAEDVVATVFTRLVRRGTGSIDDPAAYLTRATVNEAISYKRRRRREQRLLVRLHVDAVDMGLDARELLGALRVLNCLERAVIVLHYYEDRSIDDVAAVLQVARGTAASAQSRALGKLRRTLER